MDGASFIQIYLFNPPKYFYTTKIIQNYRTNYSYTTISLQSYTFFYTRASARQIFVVFIFAIVCVEGADWECLETKIRHNVPTKIRKNRGMCVFFCTFVDTSRVIYMPIQTNNILHLESTFAKCSPYSRDS